MLKMNKLPWLASFQSKLSICNFEVELMFWSILFYRNGHGVYRSLTYGYTHFTSNFTHFYQINWQNLSCLVIFYLPSQTFA